MRARVSAGARCGAIAVDLVNSYAQLDGWTKDPASELGSSVEFGRSVVRRLESSRFVLGKAVHTPIESHILDQQTRVGTLAEGSQDTRIRDKNGMSLKHISGSGKTDDRQQSMEGEAVP